MKPGFIKNFTRDTFHTVGEKVGSAISFVKDKAAEGSYKARDTVHNIADLPWSIPEDIGRTYDTVKNALGEYKAGTEKRDMTAEESQRYLLSNKTGETISANTMSPMKQKINVAAGNVRTFYDSLPLLEGETEKKYKEEVKEDYRWLDHAKADIDKITIHDISPVIDVEKGQIGMKTRSGGYYNHYGDVVKNANTDSSTSAHEILHQMFAKGYTPGSNDPEAFNQVWDSIIESAYRQTDYDQKFYRGQDAETADPNKTFTRKLSRWELDFADLMAYIDENMRSSVLYKDNLAQDYTRTVANERFAYLGEYIGRKSWGGDLPPELFRYYRGIFDDQSAPPAPYQNHWAAEESQEYNQYLKEQGRY